MFTCQFEKYITINNEKLCTFLNTIHITFISVCFKNITLFYN